MKSIRALGIPAFFPWVLMAALSALPLAAQSAQAKGLSASITQIDPSRLMSFQKNRLYVRAVGADGRIADASGLSGLEVYESADGIDYVKAGKPKAIRAPNKDSGVTFLFLIDNSLSMYRDMSGKAVNDPEATRAAGAKAAAREFLLSVTSSKDSVGMASFNTRYALIEAPSRDMARSGKAMDAISEPANDEGYTELYAAVVMASRDLGVHQGRRALIVLSDGENFPFYRESGRESPAFGARTYDAEESLDEAVREGITVFAVNFGTIRDSRLADIARKSGGEVFDARDAEELSRIYATIRDNILKEVLLEYRAAMFSGDKRWVKLGFEGGPAPSASSPSGDRFYYTGTVFGSAYEGLGLWILLLVPLFLLVPLVIGLSKFEKPSISANLSLLYAPGAGKGTKMFAVGDRTVIGSDATADITLSGNTRLKSSPVTIVKERSTGKFTIVSDEALTVNNRSLTRKTLEPGDVINFNGTIAVFDDADLDPSKRTATSTRKWDKGAPRKRRG